MPNDKLFKDGLNLIIMENKNYDITNNIHVICPSNVYSNNFFTNSKPTFMLYKEGDFYEPIFILYNKVYKKYTTPLRISC